MSEDDLSQVLHQLKSFDRPDMYAILKDKIVIIEHFEFDVSVCSRKGMKGIKEERLWWIIKARHAKSYFNWKWSYIPANTRASQFRDDNSF